MNCIYSCVAANQGFVFLNKNYVTRFCHQRVVNMAESYINSG